MPKNGCYSNYTDMKLYTGMGVSLTNSANFAVCTQGKIVKATNFVSEPGDCVESSTATLGDIVAGVCKPCLSASNFIVN